MLPHFSNMMSFMVLINYCDSLSYLSIYFININKYESFQGSEIVVNKSEIDKIWV
jgi:hypothetical protein